MNNDWDYHNKCLLFFLRIPLNWRRPATASWLLARMQRGMLKMTCKYSFPVWHRENQEKLRQLFSVPEQGLRKIGFFSVSKIQILGLLFACEWKFINILYNLVKTCNMILKYEIAFLRIQCQIFVSQCGQKMWVTGFSFFSEMKKFEQILFIYTTAETCHKLG